MSGTEARFGTWVEQGFDLYKKNFAVLVLAALIAGALSAISFGLLSGPMAAGMILIVFRLMDGGEPKPQAGDVLKGFEIFLQPFLFMLVWGAILGVVSLLLNMIPCLGTILYLVVVLGASPVFGFGLFLVVDRKRDFWNAAIESFQTLKPSFFPLLGISVVAAIMGSIGAVACGIGVVITMPLYYCIMAHAYRDAFRGPETPPQPEMVSVNPDPENG